MRQLLRRVHAGSPSPLARDLAGTLMGLVPETFSGVYANADQATRWLSTRAFADLVSGNGFRTRDLCDGRLTVFVQVPLKVLREHARARPGGGRRAAERGLRGRRAGQRPRPVPARRGGPARADGRAEAARDAGRKYGLTLLLLYQSAGQLVEQWGKEGARAWHDSTSWRMYAAVQDPETARELSAVCGRHGVVATSRGESTGTRGGLAATSSGRSESRSELGRALIGADEICRTCGRTRRSWWCAAAGRCAAGGPCTSAARDAGAGGAEPVRARGGGSRPAADGR